LRFGLYAFSLANTAFLLMFTFFLDLATAFFPLPPRIGPGISYLFFVVLRFVVRFFAVVFAPFFLLTERETTRRLLFLLDPPLLKGVLWSTSLPGPGFSIRFAAFLFARAFFAAVEEWSRAYSFL